MDKEQKSKCFLVRIIVRSGMAGKLLDWRQLGKAVGKNWVF